MSPTTKRFRPPRRVRQAFGPFKGMRTAVEERASDPALVDYAYNMLPTGPDGAYTVRPPVGATAGLPVTDRRGYHSFTDASDVVHIVTIAGSELWTLENNTSWAKRISGATLAAASIGISGSDAIGFCTFAGKLVVSDGTNTPWAWDGTQEGGLTLLSACPVLYGPPTEYGGKLFGIKAADRRTIVWSEENDPTTGYEDAGFNNAWTIAQQADEPLVRLLGRNDALYYWRLHSTGAISGAVSADFRTTHTHDAVSVSEGTIDPRSIVDTGNALWWYTTDERIVRYVVGGGIEDMTPERSASPTDDLVPTAAAQWTRSTTQTRQVDTVTAALVGPNAVQRRRQVWFSLRGLGAGATTSDGGIILAYDALTGLPLGWLGPSLLSSGVARNLTSITVGTNDLSFGNTGTVSVALSDGNAGAPYVWQWAPSGSTATTDAFSPTTALTGILVGPIAGGTDDIEMAWLDCAVSTRLPPKGNTEAAATIALLPSTSSDLLGTMLSTTVVPHPAIVTTGRTVFWIEEIGRWFRPTFLLTWNGVAVGYGIQGYTVSAAGANEDPDAA